MPMVRIDLCSDGVPIAQIPTEHDWGMCTRLVDLNDRALFAQSITFYLGAAHALMALPQFKGIEVTIEVDGDLTEEDVKQLDAHFRYTNDYLKNVVGDSGYIMDYIDWRVVATPFKKH